MRFISAGLGVRTVGCYFKRWATYPNDHVTPKQSYCEVSSKDPNKPVDRGESLHVSYVRILVVNRLKITVTSVIISRISSCVLLN